MNVNIMGTTNNNCWLFLSSLLLRLLMESFSLSLFLMNDESVLWMWNRSRSSSPCLTALWSFKLGMKQVTALHCQEIKKRKGNSVNVRTFINRTKDFPQWRMERW
jgi:hypothetical protein